LNVQFSNAGFELKPKAAPPSKTNTEEESLPEFEKSFVDKISSQFTGDVEVGYIKENRTRVNVKKEKILEVAQFIKDNLPFDHAESVTGVDFPEDKEIGVKAFLQRTDASWIGK